MTLGERRVEQRVDQIGFRQGDQRLGQGITFGRREVSHLRLPLEDDGSHLLVAAKKCAGGPVPHGLLQIPAKIVNGLRLRSYAPAPTTAPLLLGCHEPRPGR